jgi:TPR repeat protein
MDDLYEREKFAHELINCERFDHAIEMLDSLVEDGSEYALLSLGWLYEGGAKSKLDFEKAKYYYQRAVKCGFVSAHSELGRLLDYQGLEVEARKVCEAGAVLGNVPCMARLGEMLTQGRGGSVDFETGIHWLQAAAAEGHFFAQRQLLGFEIKSAKSLRIRFRLWRRILVLGKELVVELLRDPNSDKVR